MQSRRLHRTLVELKHGQFWTDSDCSDAALSIGGKGLPSLEIHPMRLTLLIALFLAGCAADGGDNDPLRPVNLAVHGVNKGLDTVVLRPASKVYGAVLPQEVQNSVRNGAANLSLPGDVVNHALQGQIGTAARMTGRFVMNSTIGIAGLFDPATNAGLPADDTDFGETLAVWGVGEGPYVELPVFGPSTARGAVGKVVDIAFDPLSHLAGPRESDVILAAKALEIVDTRHRLGEVLDSTLYDSADSYEAAKQAYLANRRRNLKGGTTDEDLEDPFAFDE